MNIIFFSIRHIEYFRIYFKNNIAILSYKNITIVEHTKNNKHTTNLNKTSHVYGKRR